MNTRLDTLAASYPMPTWRPVARGTMVFLAAALVWSYFTHLDEVSVTMGEVVPQGKIKVIQHLEGGIIEAIHVREGDTVKVGIPLVQLDLATSGVNREELSVRLDGLVLNMARLGAQIEGKEPQFPAAESKRRPDFVASERKAYFAAKESLDSTLQVMREQVKQREREVEESEAKLGSIDRNLRLARERLGMSKSLVSEGLTSKMDHLQMQAEVENLDGQVRSILATIPKLRAGVAEAQERLREATFKFRRDTQEELGRVEKELARVREMLNLATDQGARALIRSPIDGVVKNMRYNTIGGVVRPGEPIMEIVPTGEILVVEAKLSPVDRGFVEVGQPAVVKVSTYDFVRYGGLNGKVTLVDADSTVAPDGTPYFRVVVQTDKTHLGSEEGKLPITPGMEATVDIHTGTKSVLQYLVTPVLKLRYEAFRER